MATSSLFDVSSREFVERAQRNSRARDLLWWPRASPTVALFRYFDEKCDNFDLCCLLLGPLGPWINPAGVNRKRTANFLPKLLLSRKFRKRERERWICPGVERVEGIPRKAFD